ncbi:alpha/beta-gliadin clone PW1215-like [Helianthus annuus]|uniref:alpha/beta-gliadin clone PW1215-like n=1 Tax=Helianthus annuus TaxID=4232 RepID=UPI000B8F5E79|nr:alpha/beta-gliadin clone PW1215-like [Helianthus annuus]
MYFGRINPVASSSQQPKLQTAFISNSSPFPQVTNVNPFGFVPEQPQSKPQFDPSAWFPKPQAVTPSPQPQFDLSAWFPQPQPQPQVTQPQSQPQFDPSAWFPKPQVVTPSPQPQQAFYGNNFTQPQNSNTTRLDTSNLPKVNVEVAKEHMELLSTMVNAYCGWVAGQIKNINLTNEDYQQIDRDEIVATPVP